MSALSTLSDDISILSFEIYQEVPDDIGQTVNPDVLAFELGVWLAGLKTFFGSPGRLFGAAGTPESGRDWSKECKLVHSVLLIAARLTSKLNSSVRRSADPSVEIQAKDLNEISSVIRDSVVLTESFIRSKPADIQEFGLFCNAISTIFDGSRAVEDLIDRAAHSGEE
ncbi:MAG: hypothetical protein ABI539_09060, partial [Acidobacteriota bacterium]